MELDYENQQENTFYKAKLFWALNPILDPPPPHHGYTSLCPLLVCLISDSEWKVGARGSQRDVVYLG
jgi:hypothetical protein